MCNNITAQIIPGPPKFRLEMFTCVIKNRAKRVLLILQLRVGQYNLDIIKNKGHKGMFCAGGRRYVQEKGT